MPKLQKQMASNEQSTLLAWLTRPEFLVVMGIVLICICLLENHSYFDDDAYITLRYARHVLAGYGPVWNTSGPRVEGFTSPLHLLLVCAVGALRIPMREAARAVDVVCHLALLTFAAAHLIRRTNQLGAYWGVLILAASWMLIVWDLGGLDAVLYATLTTAGILAGIDYFACDENGSPRLLLIGTVYLAFATLARPEGVLLLGGLLLFAALDSRRKSIAERFTALATAAALALIVLLPLVLFRWFYFHEWAPNTFYAKIGGIGKQELIRLGMQYFVSFLKTPPFLGPLALGAAIYAVHKGKFRVQDAALWGFMPLVVLFIVVSGGDHMTAFRFCLPLVPLLTVALIQHLYQTGLLSNHKFTCVFTPLILILLALQSQSAPLNPKVLDPAARVGEMVGRYIHEHWCPGSVVALNTAGSTPYYADEMQYIDMLGLNDAEIARRKDVPEFGPWTKMVGHLKGNGASVLSRQPDYIILGPAEGTTPELRRKVYFIGDHEIGTARPFKENYEVCVVRLADGLPFTYFQRRDRHQPCPDD